MGILVTSHRSHVTQQWKYYRTSPHHLLKQSKSPVYLYITLSMCVDSSRPLFAPRSKQVMCTEGLFFYSIRCQAHLGAGTPGGRLADSWEQRENSRRHYCTLQRAAAGWERDAAPGAVSLETAA